MIKEWTIDQIRDFVKKDYPSVAARMTKCLLAYFDELAVEKTNLCPEHKKQLHKCGDGGYRRQDCYFNSQPPISTTEVNQQ